MSVRENLPDIQNLKFMVYHCWHLPGVAGSADCHVSITFQPFLQYIDYFYSSQTFNGTMCMCEACSILLSAAVYVLCIPHKSSYCLFTFFVCTLYHCLLNI